MKTTHQELFNTFYENLLLDISKNIKEKGVKSDFSSTNVIKIENDDHQHNLSNSSWIVEVYNEGFIDGYGYKYSFSAIDIEQLIQLVDYINEL